MRTVCHHGIFIIDQYVGSSKRGAAGNRFEEVMNATVAIGPDSRRHFR